MMIYFQAAGSLGQLLSSRTIEICERMVVAVSLIAGQLAGAGQKASRAIARPFEV